MWARLTTPVADAAPQCASIPWPYALGITVLASVTTGPVIALGWWLACG